MKRKKTIKEDVKSARKNMTDSQKAMKGLDEATITTVKEKDKLGEKYKRFYCFHFENRQGQVKRNLSIKILSSVYFAVLYICQDRNRQ